MPQLYLDMDGVLADFDRHYMDTFHELPPKHQLVDSDGHDIDWSKISATPDFYYGIPPMKDMWELWEYAKHFTPIVLTGVPSSVKEAPYNKRNWIAKWLGPDVKVICCKSKEKCLHAEPGDVLVDDWEKYKHLWVKQGGVWITHKSASQTIAALRQLIDEGAVLRS